jgi:S-adenosylmethionine:tRNA ribosyltransferase-isomerase
MGTRFKIALDGADPTLTDAYDYDLPEELIAATPSQRREAARMMVVDPKNQQIEHASFADLPRYLGKNDRLCFNNTRVIPGRIMTYKQETRGRVELLVLELADKNQWNAPCINGEVRFDCMTRSSKGLREGLVLECSETVSFEVLSCSAGRAIVRCHWEGTPMALLERCGQMPLPPYIVKRRKELGLQEEMDLDQDRYQTVYADQPGAIAAPTAGLHFTPDLLEQLANNGVNRSEVTLHVGPGTFKPMTGENLKEHEMHFETYVVSDTLGAEIEATKKTKGNLIAVGTTSARVLEAETRLAAPFQPGKRQTDLFLYPGHGFEICDGLITNFHLPRSTLLTLVASRMGYAMMRRVYDEAIEKQYKFYSYGDGMLILDGACAP